MYTIETISKVTSIEDLLKYYDNEKVENYCKNCQNYNNIWSCPPHNFNTFDYLKQYNQVNLHAVKIIFEDSSLTKEDRMEIFQKERRLFSDRLLSMEKDHTRALIAGNCYQCQVCNRQKKQACILKDKMRYSLEALGLIVGDVTSHLLNIELEWSSDGLSSYYVTVGGILKKI